MLSEQKYFVLLIFILLLQMNLEWDTTQPEWHKIDSITILEEP